MTLPSLHWLQSETGRIQKWHLFLMLVFLALPNAVHATDCLVSPVLPCTFTLTEPFAAYANWPTQPIDFRYDGGSELVKNAKIVNGGGTELPFQWVSLCWDPTATLGCIEIQDSLPSGATRTYTLEAGPPSARVANPVVVARNNVTCYSGGARCIQLTNGLTGVQVPSPASNGSAASHRLAPIQAIGLPNGGWTGAIGGSGNPNLIYGEAQGGAWTRYYGGIPNWDTGLQTPITSATGYSEKFLEIGPLKTTIQLTYSFNRPDYWSAAAGISKYYWWFNCNAATSGQPQGSVYWAGQNGQPSVFGPGLNMTVVFDGSGFCPVGSGSAPLDSSHYYTATQIPGTQNYTLSTVVGGVVTPVIITGSTESQIPTIDGRGKNWPLTGFIINSATCPKYPTPCADGRQNEQPGRYVVTVTMYANSKSILVTEDSDMLHAEYYPFYHEITPDTARFRTSRGTGTSDPRCGYSAPVSVTGVGSGPATATIATSTAVSNGQFVLLTGVGSGSNLPNGVYYLQTTSPYSATTPGVWTNSNFTGATTAPGSYTSGGLVKYAGAASGVQNSPVSDTGFDFPWTYGDSGFSEADPFPSLYQGCQISSGHLTSTPSLVVNNPPADANSVTAWENYQAGGSGSSPVLGWFTGDAGLMKQAGTMPGLYAAASGFVSGWGRTAAIQDAQRLVSIGNPALGITAPTIDNWGSQKSWGIFVDTNSNLPAFSSSTHPPIQDDQNKYTGVNLSHVYAYRSGSTSAPPGGWQWLYMANSNATNAGQQMNCLIARVRDGSSTCSGMFPDGRTATPCGGSGSTCYHDLLYNNSATDPTSRAILNMWQSEVSSPSTAVGTAITASNCPNLFSGVGASLAAGDNHFDSTYGGYLAALYINPCFSFWNAVLMDPNSTMAQQSQMTMEAAAIGGLLWDNSWTARDGSYTNNVPGTYCYLCFISVAGDGAGTDNQQVTYAQYRATLAYQYGVNGANAFLATKVPASQSSNNQTLQLSIGCAGAMSAGTHYTQTYNAALIPSAQITALQGGNTFSQCQFTQGYPTWFLATTTPPDPRYGNTRKKVALGDTATEEGDVFPGLLATGLYATNPAPAKAMSWLWHQYGTSTFQYLNYLISGLLNVDETIPQVAPSLTSQQINGYFSVHRSGTQGGGQENALWFINGGCCGQGNIYYNLSGHRHYDDGHVSIFALGAPLAGYWGANLYNPQTSDRFSQNSITFDAEMNGTSWSQNSPPFNTYGMQLLGSPTVTAFHAFGNSTQSTATFTYPGDGAVWTRAVRTMAPDPNYPIFYIKDTFAGGSGGGKTLTWNLEATRAVTTPSGSKIPVTSFQNGCNGNTVYPSANDTSGMAPYSLANGLQQFTFTGFNWPRYAGGNLKWNLYQRPTSGSAQFLIGNWGHGCGAGAELSQFQTANASASWFNIGGGNYCASGNTSPFCDWQHILRVHDTGPFETVITPTVASGTPPSVLYSNGVYTATFGANESLAWNDSYSTFTNGVTQILTIYDSSPQSTFGMTASGGPQEITTNGAGTITWTIDDVNPATRSLMLPPGAWYPSGPVQQSAGAYTYYHAGGVQPSPSVVTFTQTPVTLRSVPLNYAAPAGASQVRVKFGNTANYAAIAACNPLCSIVMLSPLGTWPEQHDFLDPNGNVVASSPVQNVAVQ